MVVIQTLSKKLFATNNFLHHLIKLSFENVFC